MKWTSGPPTDFKKIFRYISWSNMHQIWQPRTVLISLESEEFKTVLGCPIWCIFDQDIYLKIFLKSAGPPVRFIFSLYLTYIKAIKVRRFPRTQTKNIITRIVINVILSHGSSSTGSSDTQAPNWSIFGIHCPLSWINKLWYLSILNYLYTLQSVLLWFFWDISVSPKGNYHYEILLLTWTKTT